jgi:hypothetical protein
MVIFTHAHGKNPDSVPNQGSWGGKAQQTPSQGKRENVREETGVLRAAAHGEAYRLHTRRLTAWTVSKARGVPKRAPTPPRP